jgi:glycosyltransferase involved in cell wall biosynthesis
VSLAEKLGIPIVVTLHGYDVTIRTDFQTRYEKLWRKADRFICVSEFIRKKAIEAGFPPEKLVVHYIGIDRKRFAPVNSDRAGGMALFVGRLVEKKGCSYLLSAMQRVQNRHINARLVVIGDGPLRKSLEQHARELKLNCSFLGAQSQDVVRKNLQAASVLCVPSVAARNGDSEGLPITILEALCMKVPVVASRHAGIPEAVLDGETGLLASERDEKELAEQILRFLTDEPFRNACSRRGSDWIATQFDLISQTRQLENIYEEVVMKAKHRIMCETKRTSEVSAVADLSASSRDQHPVDTPKVTIAACVAPIGIVKEPSFGVSTSHPTVPVGDPSVLVSKV